MVKNHWEDFLKHQQVVNRYLVDRKAELQQEIEFNYHAISKFDPEQMDIETLEQLVGKAISELPEPCRKVFEMSRYEGLKYKEIAERLQISVKTVETQMSNSLKILRIRLKDFTKLGAIQILFAVTVAACLCFFSVVEILIQQS